MYACIACMYECMYVCMCVYVCMYDLWEFFVDTFLYCQETSYSVSTVKICMLMMLSMWYFSHVVCLTIIWLSKYLSKVTS